MGNIEKMIGPADGMFEVKQRAQMEIMMAEGGKLIAADWIEANAARFEELMKEENANFIERLANPDTHDAAIEEIKKILYH